jgi:galactitol-specific phosphotransferase system IIB component
MAKKISYATRDFAGLREELVNLTNDYYPDLVKNTNDASIFSVLLDLNAAVADNLHFHIDRVWQETMLDFAQQRQSLYHIAKTYGLRIPGNRPSVALCDFSINVPVSGDKEKTEYLGILRSGAQVSGGGQIFETIEDIDFSNPFNSRGEPNRLKIPNFDGNNKLISYTIVKREPVVNGVTRIFRRVVTTLDQKPFLKLFLPEQNVLGIVSVIHKEGTNYGANPTTSEFMSSPNKWYEVKSMVQDKVFIPDPTKVSDTNNFKPGKYIKVNNKFITEYTPEGYFSLTFGSGNVNSLDNLDNYLTDNLKVNLGSYLNNFSLGAVPKANTTIFIKYRVGGGKDTNLGVNVINSIDEIEFNVNGPVPSINTQVIQSLRVTNVTPAIGGSDQPTVDEIRNLIAYNFAAQNRAVTLNDYKSIIENMPSTYGAPAKVSVMEEDNKVKVKLLSFDQLGNLSGLVSTTLKENIVEYLSEFRMINDYVEIETGEVIDFGVEIDIVCDRNEIESEIIKSVIQNTIEYFSIDKRKMGDPLFVGDLFTRIGTLPGVVNVVDIRIFNKMGGEYSTSEVSQEYVDEVSKLIKQSDMTIFMKSNQIFQVRFPNKDIRVRVKPLISTTF